MAGSRKSGYPDTYGKPTSALPDILGPMNVDEEGDVLAPRNDMAEIAPDMCMGREVNDPLGLVYCIETNGAKSKK
jgi:hypothetical protein